MNTRLSLKKYFTALLNKIEFQKSISKTLNVKPGKIRSLFEKIDTKKDEIIDETEVSFLLLNFLDDELFS